MRKWQTEGCASLNVILPCLSSMMDFTQGASSRLPDHIPTAQKHFSEDNRDTVLKIYIVYKGNLWQGWNPVWESQDHAFFLPAIPSLVNSKPLRVHSKWNMDHTAACLFPFLSKASPAEERYPLEENSFCSCTVHNMSNLHWVYQSWKITTSKVLTL